MEESGNNMPIYNEMDNYLIMLNNQESGNIVHDEVKVGTWHKHYSYIRGELDYLLATLSLEINRERLKQGEGWEDLFNMVDEMRERIKDHDEPC